MAGHSLYREAHPLVFVITHWINLICMVALAFSGFYIHYPFFEGFMGSARAIHFFAMFVVIINLAFRVLAAFIVKTANQPGTREVDLDLKNWLPQEENRHQLLETVKYYLFLRKEATIAAKYNPLQKMSYIATVPLTLLMAYTGFALYGPSAGMSFFAAGTELVGGPMNMRIIHYFGMWAIILFTMVHAYLASIYNFNPLRIMFLWKETEAGH